MHPTRPAPEDPKPPAAAPEPPLRDPPDESVAGEEDPGSGLEQFSDALRSPSPPAHGKDSRDPYGPGASPGGDSGQQRAPDKDTSAPSTSSK